MKNTNSIIETKRHSLAHLLAMAVLQFDPEAKLGMGPAIENGFYYDFALSAEAFGEGGISTIHLRKLEKQIKKYIQQSTPFIKEEISKDEAKKMFAKQPHKLELIEELEGDTVSIYKSGNFVDLCAGPHIESAKELNADGFKLTRIAGAYWKGDEKNKMLTRVYGIYFDTKEELEDYLHKVEEAEKRNHRKIGKEMDLFCFSDLIGPGLPLYTPKGTILKEELQKHIEEVCRKYGFQKVSAPSLAKPELFEISGHAKKFSDELFHVTSEKKHDFILKPVQCPHQTQIYASKTRSYKDLPIRYMESDKQYRAEKTGEVGGLNRVYAITVEDGHTFCTPEQIKDEIKSLVNIIKDFYSALGLWENHWVSLSVRDYAHPEKYIGDLKDWDKCEEILQEISDEMELGAKKCEGEAALYGPKLDFMFKDALGKEIQIPTVQLDFATPKRFNLYYTNKKGEKQNPVMIHRAILGSYERFLVLLIEHYAGEFPLWLSPVQVLVLPIGEKFNEYGKEVLNELRKAGLRAEADLESDTLGKKIINAQKQKIPYILVVGEKEAESRLVAVRSREKNAASAKATAPKKDVMKLEEFIKRAKKEAEEKSI